MTAFDMCAAGKCDLLGTIFFGTIMQPIDYELFFRFFTGMLGRNAECYADVVRHKLS
jgi:hypothetical protein